ncbi:SAM-dependent methyltransferase [Sphingomonas sp. Leaf4]|uniref:SAM-dependent methyltransferase n=1 Tax=Sphingomonas sp. Leaf4 TaxID=2876553 RepID=UPI001E5D7E7B|nr:cyclopropane-fatty-acyl-phospholipid synthase family protein [Sphingomonas sp. Leaf4]
MSADPFALLAPLFARALDRIDHGLAAGAIEATLPDGSRRRLGGRGDGPVAIVVLHRWRAMWRLARGGSAGWYEAWADGDWSSPDPVPLFDLFMRNAQTLGTAARAGGVSRLLRRLNHRARRNDRPGAKANIAAHYDLGNDFYREWLDPTLTYSSAIFADPHEPLEAAQHRKLAAILDRTATASGERILEIGCGWGSFAATASAAGRQVDAITLSTRQLAQVEALALPGVAVSLTDYRDVTGQYDAIASIEMVEAVGHEYWPAYLDTIAARLKPGGRAALQYIAIAEPLFDAYAGNVDFIQAHVFPGGMLLSERRFRALAKVRGLAWRDVHHFGLDYAETLRRWRHAFDTARADGRLPMIDDRFADLWRYYLMYCEGGFRGGGITVAQVTLVKGG